MALRPYRESRVVDIPGDTLFDLVADVERYPEFLPLMARAKIVNRGTDAYETEQTLALGLLAHSFRTRTELDRPHAIRVTSADPAFSRFEIQWSFAPTPEGHCRVDFSLDYEVRWFWLKPLGEVLLSPMAQTMVDAFVARARRQAAAGSSPGK